MSTATSKDRGWLLGLMLDNFWLKLGSLCLALGLYAFLNSASNAQRTVQVTVIADMPPPDTNRLLMTEIPDAVSIIVTGPRQQLDTFDTADLDPIRLNLTAAQDVPDLRFVPEMITGLPLGVTVERIIPASTKIEWEDILTRNVPVRVEVEGSPAQGMRYEGLPELEPGLVAATGPESNVKVIQSITAAPFDGRGLGEGRHTRSLALGQPPPNVTFNHRFVDATVTIVATQAQREWNAVEVEVIGLPKSKRPKVFVAISGPPAAVKAIKDAEIVPRVDPKEAGHDVTQTGSALMKPQLSLDGVKVTIKPTDVLVSW